MLLTIVTFILVLSILVFVHELGHFYVARKLGIKAEEFGFGFPPRAWGVYRDYQGRWKQVWGRREVKDCPGTVYSFNWFPLGGFVKIKGENGEEESEPDSFAGRPVWQRAITLSAGVTMNVALAAILISFGLMIGLPQALDDVGPRAQVSQRKIQVVLVVAKSPAAAAGLMIGDDITAINNQPFKDYESLQQFVDQHVGESLHYQIKRGEEEFDFEITPETREETGRGGIGIALAETGLVRYPWYIAIWRGVEETLFLTWAIIVAFYELFKGLLLGQGISSQVAGPVGIAHLTGQVARLGFIYLLQFTALLSINLAIINFLPFPALDGGRVLFLLIEKIKGSPVKQEIEGAIHNIGFSLLMVLILVVTFRDVLKLGGRFAALWGKIMGLF